MTGWQWFWTLVGFIVLIIALVFLYYYQPFEDLFVLVLNGISFSNAIFWVALVVAIIGFCTYHWHAYRVHIVEQQNIESMVMSSLSGSTLTAIILCGGAALQAVQILCVYLLDEGYGLNGDFVKRLGAMLALLVLTGLFCIIFWLLKVVRLRAAQQAH